ncbi:MAG TPA: carboxypeptidase-like regulatory domain-containing protein, partial [Chitinispirillaceae bacterium]|nr:carboxypeptidase-like regulatory domain-containing protein [Chitinispirillaceae bacterium]
MVRKNLLLFMSAASCFLSTATGQVDLKGTVKDGSGAAIAGAVVSLSKKPFKDTTDTKGEFNIAEATGTLTLQNSVKKEMNFAINGHQVFFSIPAQMKTVTMNIISANGQNVYESSFETTTEKIPAIPRLNSGVFLIKLTSFNH